MLHNNTIQYSWETLEFEFKEKNKKWFYLMSLAGIILIVISVLMNNYLLAFLVLLATVLVFSQANKQPLLIDVEISEQGINIHQNLHPFENIKAFWMKETSNEQVMLILLTSQTMTPIESLMIPENVNPLELREYLLNFIPEEQLRESYTEQLMKMIGF